jgi:hypothetical protein
VCHNGRIKILDFGLAKQNVPGGSEKTASGDFLTEQGTVMAGFSTGE